MRVAASVSESSARNAGAMLADPEAWEDSEGQFEDSLVSSAKPEYYRSIDLGLMSEAAEHMSQNTVQHDLEPEMPRGRTGLAQRRALDYELTEQAERWRDALGDKLSDYRNRRGKTRLSGDYTMHLDFERSTGRATLGASVAATAAAYSTEPEYGSEQATNAFGDSTAASEFGVDPELAPGLRTVETSEVLAATAPLINEPPALAAPPVPEPPKPRRPEPKIIEFPRLFPMEPHEGKSDELAESMIDRPRIIDVPEETDQIELPLGDIRLENPVKDEAAHQTEIETPFQVAAVSQRVFASIADWVLVLVGTALFGAVALNLTKGIPQGKLVLAMALAIPCVFWGVYHYLFLVHAAATPGMLMARLRLATFDGRFTNRHVRRSRALAMFLSCASAGLGFCWALVDEDTLCWHDKISRTYLTNNR